MKPVKIADWTIDDTSLPLLVAGPCVIEDEDEALRLAEAISQLPSVRNYNFVFKSSYLKDNRSSTESYRGPGLDKGLEILDRIKKSIGCPVLSDVHCREEIDRAAEVLDVIQIPAFLSRQTRLVEKIAAKGKALNIKKGQFLSPADVKLIIEKAEGAGGTNITVTERGTTFGYHDLVVDFRSFPKLRGFGYPVLFDATHSLQKPAGLGNRSGGEPALAGTLARAAASIPCDGLFVETHFNPESALSDAASMLPFSRLDGLLESTYQVYSLVKEMAQKGMEL